MREAYDVMRAMATNVLAGALPSFYVRLTGQTGRGDPATESTLDVAEYFVRCFDEYLSRLGVARAGAEKYCTGLTLVEYGPGDLPGVAALFAAYGAGRVYCVDRFAMVRLSERNLGVLRRMQGLIPEPYSTRLGQLLVPERDGQMGLDSDRIRYLVRPHGFSGLESEADVVFSRAVLEHVDDLDGTFRDMFRALKPGGVSLHQVDLRSHGLHRSNVLDFLSWPQWLWSLMFSNKGVPNRWRVDRYREILRRLGVGDASIEPTICANPADIREVRPALARPFRTLSDDDLAVLGFWAIFRKPGALQ